ncbi:patched domain-containing protein 1-like [Lampetra planeri]
MLRQTLRCTLKTCFNRLGFFVSRHPVFFASAPLLLSVLLGASLSRYEVEGSMESLFAPQHSLAKHERRLVDSLFPINGSRHMLFTDLHSPGRYGRLVVTSRSGRDVLDAPAVDAILRAHAGVLGMRVSALGFNYTYAHICTLDASSRCLQDALVDVLEQMRRSTSGNRSAAGFRPTYPTTRLGSGREVFLGHRLGNVSLSDKGVVRSSKALQITYYLSTRDRADELVADSWEEAFCRTLDKIEDAGPDLQFHAFTSSSLRQDFQMSSVASRPFLIASAAAVTIAAAVCCSMRDPVRTRPWLGVLGVVTIFLSTLTTAGIINLTEGKYNSTLLGLPFIVIGHGMHGMFEMLSSWRKSKDELGVKERLALVYTDTMVSFTLTSAMYLVTFGLGASPFTNLGAVKVFCRSTCVAILFNYLYLLSFFGSCLVFAGYVEARGQHGALCCVAVPTPPPQPPPPGCCRVTERSHRDRHRATPGASENPAYDFHVTVWFLREHCGKWLTNTYVKPFVVLLYLVYVSFAMMGCLQVREGCDLGRLLATDSRTLRYRALQREYFSSYGPAIGFYVYEPLDYWNESVQEGLRAITAGFVRSSWLESFLAFLEKSNGTAAVGREAFVRALLRSFFAARPFVGFADDLILATSNGSVDISASRMYLAAGRTALAREEVSGLLDTLRRRSLASDVKFVIFNPSFVFVDRCASSIGYSALTPCAGALAALLLSAPLSAEPLANAWLSLCALSAGFGALGYMTLWDVRVDFVSALCLVFGVNYAVEHCAPLVAAFAAGQELTRTRWIQVAVELNGSPVLQSLACFAAALAPLSLAPSNLTYTLFRGLLVAALAVAFHVLVVLPVVLTFFPPSKRRRRRRKRPPPEPRDEIECVELHSANRVTADQAIATRCHGRPRELNSPGLPGKVPGMERGREQAGAQRRTSFNPSQGSHVAVPHLGLLKVPPPHPQRAPCGRMTAEQVEDRAVQESCLPRRLTLRAPFNERGQLPLGGPPSTRLRRQALERLRCGRRDVSAACERSFVSLRCCPSSSLDRESGDFSCSSQSATRYPNRTPSLEHFQLYTPLELRQADGFDSSLVIAQPACARVHIHRDLLVPTESRPAAFRRVSRTGAVSRPRQQAARAGPSRRCFETAAAAPRDEPARECAGRTAWHALAGGRVSTRREYEGSGRLVSLSRLGVSRGGFEPIATPLAATRRAPVARRGRLATNSPPQRSPALKHILSSRRQVHVLLAPGQQEGGVFVVVYDGIAHRLFYGKDCIRSKAPWMMSPCCTSARRSSRRPPHQKMNWRKCSVPLVGVWYTAQCPEKANAIDWSTTSSPLLLHHLGVSLGPEEEPPQRNWLELEEKVKERLGTWRRLCNFLTFRTKTLVVNQLEPADKAAIHHRHMERCLANARLTRMGDRVEPGTRGRWLGPAEMTAKTGLQSLWVAARILAEANVKRKVLYSYMVQFYQQDTFRSHKDHAWRRALPCISPERPLWRQLYSSPTYNRIGDLSWSIAHGTVTTNASLARFTDTSSECRFCGKMETVVHQYVECKSLDSLFKRASPGLGARGSGHRRGRNRPPTPPPPSTLTALGSMASRWAPVHLKPLFSSSSCFFNRFLLEDVSLSPKAEAAMFVSGGLEAGAERLYNSRQLA